MHTDEETRESAQWEVSAARQEISVSQRVAGLLREQLARGDRYERAGSSQFAQEPRDLSSGSSVQPAATGGRQDRSPR